MFAVRAGDEDALATLFERHHARIHSLCARLVSVADADDLVQETFLRVYRHASTFAGGAGFTPWLYRIARNVCIDRGQRVSRETSVEHEWARMVATDRTSDAAGGIERRRLLETALARLPAPDREVIVLSIMRDLPYAEVAEVLGCSMAAARVRLHRAISRLRRICAELEGPDHEL